MNHRRAFTLIELLVVIAIIAILAAILFPVFAQAKLAAKQSADLSNLKQIGTSVFIYTTDNDDFFPRGTYPAPAFANPFNQLFTWREAVEPYCKNGYVQGLGGVNGRVAFDGIWQTPVLAGSRAVRSYGQHNGLMPGGYDPEDQNRNTPSTSQTQLRLPANTLMIVNVGLMRASAQDVFGDWSGLDAGFWYWGEARWEPDLGFAGRTQDTDLNCSPDWNCPWGEGGYRMPRYRYNGGTNVAWADGHAKYFKKGQLNWCSHIQLPGRDQWVFDNLCPANLRQQ